MGKTINCVPKFNPPPLPRKSIYIHDTLDKTRKEKQDEKEEEEVISETDNEGREKKDKGEGTRREPCKTSLIKGLKFDVCTSLPFSLVHL